MRLKGKTTLITGAGRGIGRSAALLFAREGARLVVCDWESALAEETVAMISAKGGEAVPAVGDVSRASDVQSAVALAVQTFGKLDILYNNAGVWLEEDGPAPEMSEETWDRVIDINLKGTFFCCKYAIPCLVEAGGGSIINVSSMAALRAGKGHYDAYAASKGGIISMTYTLASTWGPKGIRVNVICPGSIETPLTARSYEDPWVRDFWRTRTALGRVGQPTEIADGSVAGLRRVILRHRGTHPRRRRVYDEMMGASAAGPLVARSNESGQPLIATQSGPGGRS